jgi:hypothetical protein
MLCVIFHKHPTMDRTLKDLDKLEQSFIDTVYIQCKTFAEAEKLLGVERTKIRQLNRDLEPHWRPITKIRDKWKLKKIGGNFWDFCNWYKTAEQRCHYCGITQEQIDKLHLGLNNKRTTRGRTLEIDRKIADESYSNISNLTYSCYWCNNAKTDTFTEEEFKIIGQAIGTVWKQRLNK